MKHTNKRLAWLDNHILEIIAGFLLAFLPLYPKWPLFEALPGYIVHIRLEDVVIAAALTVFAVQAYRGKTQLKQNPAFYPILIYWIIGFLSSLSAIFITKTVPLEAPHVAKLFLHWARRIEYMSLALIFFSAIQTKDQLKRLLTVFAITALSVSLYGYGQKYLQWPVYSTMNREFSKGWRLVLTEHARVNSTFGGHYDLAGFTVIALPILIALAVFSKSKTSRTIYAVIFLLVFSTLLQTASRSSFISYFGSIFILTALFTQKIGYKKAIITGFLLITVSVIGYRYFGTLKQRFEHFFNVDRITRIFPQFFPEEKKPSVTISNDLQLVYDETDQPPSTPASLPPDVYEDIPVSLPEASLSGIPDTSGTGTEGQSRTYSANAQKYGLSTAIRLDALWPRALAGFKANPLLGSGYSTLTKVQVTDFTEAESTDNDFLRALGETGLLGLLSFLFIFYIALNRTFRAYLKTKDPLQSSIFIAFITFTIALMVNALYIDIFTASKVAYMYWSFVGITLAVVASLTKSKKHAQK